MGDGGTILGYRAPEGAYLTPGLHAIFEWEEPDWMYGWWCTLEIVDGVPVLYLWAGQIAG